MEESNESAEFYGLGDSGGHISKRTVEKTQEIPAKVTITQPVIAPSLKP